MQLEAGVNDRGDDTDVIPAAIPVGRWVMAAALLSLNLLDVLLTRLIIAAGGAEANPLMQGVIHDPLAAYALKFTIALGVGVLLLKSPRNSRLADRAMLATIGCYMLVIGWNLGLLISASRTGNVF